MAASTGNEDADMRLKVLVAACLLAASGMPALSARAVSDAVRLRQEAEHVCYPDVQKLCNDVIPDEDKIKSCMQRRHAELSGACAKVYDQGIGG